MSEDGETDDINYFEGWTDEEMEEVLDELLELDPEYDVEWVIEVDPEDDDIDYTYEHAGTTLH